MIVRRAVTVLAAATLMVLGGQQLAGAAFTDSSTVTTAVRTVTVAPVSGLTVTAPCTLTTQTYTTSTRRAPDGTILSGPTQSPTEVTTRQVPTPVQGTRTDPVSTTTDGDGSVTTVTRTTIEDTTVSGVATWTRSGTRGATSYTLTIPGPAPFSQNLGNADRFDYPSIAIDQVYTLPVTITTNTSYGWTASTTALVTTCRQ
jgi:hypothetical protein